MSLPVADLSHIHYAYPGDQSLTLDDLSWQIEEGSFALLIGRSGSGKSTLLRCLNGLVPHFSGGRFGGDVRVGPLDTRRSAPRELALHVGFVFQDPESQMLTDRVDDEIAFGLEQQGTARTTMRKRVEEMLDLLGIAHLRDRSPSTLSGGERQRVAIASAMATHPRILALDEPTSQLDPWGAEEVVSAIGRLNDDLGLTIVLAEHRLERVLATADTVRLLDRSGTVVDGTPQEIARLVNPVALPPVASLGRRLGWHDIPLTVKAARTHPLTGALAERLRGHEPKRSAHEGGDVLLRLEAASASHGRNRVFRDVDLSVREGEFVALMGRNGSGKTTLLRSVLGFHSLSGGRLLFAGSDRTKAKSGMVDAGIAYVPQQASSLFFLDRLSDELRYTARQRGVAVDVHDVLAKVGLEWAADRHPSDLSVGERQRAAIATVLAGRPKMLVLDEPTRGMDPWHKRQLMDVLGRIQADGVGVLMATHDVEMVARVADRVVLLGDGSVVADGTPEDVLSGSLSFSTQVNKVFGDRWLTVDQVIDAVS
jgi:energy-coupling factor transporter ATP-binding protein EcfA2